MFDLVAEGLRGWCFGVVSGLWTGVVVGMNFYAKGSESDAWAVAARLLVEWLMKNVRVDALMDKVPPELGRTGRARCQHLVFGVIRHWGRIGGTFGGLMEKLPRWEVRAVLALAGFELIEGGGEGHTARVVHHAVEQTKRLASAKEAGLVNAVVRKMAVLLAEQRAPGKLAGAKELAFWFSHPEWLVSRWLAQFGAEGTRGLLEWNQSPAEVYARWRGTVAEELGALLSEGIFKETKWAGFFEVSGNWDRVEGLLREGKVFLQDPATRLALEALGPKSGECLLDACAAPGGKSVMIADALAAAGGGRLVALDLAERGERLRENLSRVGTKVDVALVLGDLRKARPLLKEHGLPVAFAGVLADVPCSNTGVMRHRVDVKWRLQPVDFTKHARQQAELLSAAGYVTAPGGRMVYSTCSLDAEENEGVVGEFVAKTKGRWKVESQRASLPWVDGCDGASVFVLRKAEG